MYLANLWGLLGLLALPAIVAIHLYHRRFPPLYVAGAHLWSSETQVRMAGRRRDTLPWTASLFLELLAALLLTLVLSEPRIGDLDRVPHVVAVLDSSASMQGQPAGEASFRDAAIAALEKRFAALDRRAVTTLIVTGRRPSLLAGPAIPWKEAQAKLASWQPNQPRHQFAPAWDLGQQLIEKSGQLLFVTDQIPDAKELPSNLEVISIGQRLENVAISTARWAFDSETGKGQVYVRVQNHGRKPASVTVRGQAREQTLFRKPLALKPGATGAFEAEVPGGIQSLFVIAETLADGLKLDNQVLLLEPKVRTVHVAQTLPEGIARQVIERSLRAVSGVELVEREQAELVIGPAGELPESNSRLWWLGVGPLNSGEAEQKQAKDLVGPYLVDKRHPLVDGIVLGGIVWGGVQPLTAQVIPLISAGNLPLLSQLRGTRTSGFVLNIDFARSNLAESPDWPILFDNLIESRRDDLPGLRRWNYRLGEGVQFRLFKGDDPTPDTPLTLISGNRSRPLLRASLVELPILEETGLYEIRSGAAEFGKFAINFFDAEESNLRNLAPGTRPAAVTEETLGIELDNAYSWVVLIGIILILLAIFGDWYVLRPRRFSK
jgi:hypothetical protein